jgi:alpha-aminoadipic semialdehyde synthase
VAEAKDHVHEVGERLSRDGIPPALRPLVIGITGYGNVGRGAREIIAELPIAEVTPAALAAGKFDRLDLERRIVAAVFAEEHMVTPIEPGARFELQDYYAHPARYRSQFASYLPWLTLLVHCAYWDARYPRVVTRQDVERLFPALSRPQRAIGEPRLQVIGDVSCDIEGGVEITMRTTDIEDPLFVYQPCTGHTVDGFEADGPAVMAIDFLPTELPADATRSFGDALVDLVPPLARTDFRRPTSELALPSALRRALITHAGGLTPEFDYLRSHLDKVH